jgi:transposase
MIGKLPRQVHTSEFRYPAVETVTREGLGIAEASRRLSLSPKTLTNRVRRGRGGGPPAAAAPRREVTEQEAELSRLRRENAESRMERDILKKASAYCAQESLRATR